MIEQAAYHGVDALIWHVLLERGSDRQLPEWVRKELAARTARAVAIELVRANDIRTLRRRLVQARIEAVLMKGGALAYTHYPAPHLRFRTDTDIFIAPKDIRRIRAVFQESGYRLEGWIYKSHQFKALREGFGGQMIKYDVHWRSSNRSRYARVLSHEEACSSSVPVPELGGIRALSPLNALLQACMHRAASSYHDPDRLIWLYDVHLLISGMDEDTMREFGPTARRCGVTDICLQAVERSRGLFRSEVPEPVLEILRSGVSKGAAWSRVRESQLALIIDDLRALPDRRDQIDLLKEYVFPPGDYLLRRYGKTGAYWVPILYLRYLLSGIFERLALR